MKIIVEASSLEELKELLEQLTGKIAGTADCHLNALPLSARTRNCLLAEKVETLRHLAMLSERELLHIPNLGRFAVAEIRGVLAARGHTVQS